VVLGHGGHAAGVVLDWVSAGAGVGMWRGVVSGLAGLEERLEAEIARFVYVYAECAQDSIVLAARQSVCHQLSCLESGW